MSQKFFDLILRADSRQLVTGFDAARRGVQAFNRESDSGSQAIASLTGHINALIGAFAGMAAISRGADIIKSATTAAFTLDTAITAANREFANTGDADQWAASISRLSGQLRIYSQTEITEATAKTIDMTKRLGMSQAQMEELIRVTGDLSAGKFGLADGVERVTAAMRGEAEASEALGLTLNEDYVKSWYAARGATQGAWKDLTDIQKAQIRYNVFLEQAIAKQGASAASIKTLGGAIQFTSAALTDHVANNKNLVAASKELALYIADNADKIGDLAASIANAAGEFLKFVLEHKDGIATMAKITLLFVGLNKAGGLLMSTYTGIQAATVAVTGSRLIPWLGGVATGMTGAGAATTAFSLALKATPFFIVTGAVAAVAKLTQEIIGWREASNQAELYQNQLAASQDRLATKLRQVSADTGVTITSFQDLQQAAKDGIISLDNATGQWRKNTEEQKNAVLQLTQQTGQAYDTLADKARNVAGAVGGANQTIAASPPAPGSAPAQPAPFVSTMGAATPKAAPAPGVSTPPSLTSPADPATTQQAIDNYDQLADAAEQSAGRQEQAMSRAADGMLSSLSSFINSGKDMYGDLENKMKSMADGFSGADKSPEEQLAALQQGGEEMRQRAKDMLGQMASTDMSGMMGGMSMDVGSMLGAASQRMEERRRQRVQNADTPTGGPVPEPTPAYDTPSTDNNRLVQVNGEWRNVSDADIVQSKVQGERIKAAAEEDTSNIARNQRLQAPQDPSGGKSFSNAAGGQRGLGGAPVEKIHKVEIGEATLYADDEEQVNRFVKQMSRYQMRA